MKANWRRNGLIYIVLIIMAIAFFAFFYRGPTAPTQVTFDQVVALSKEGKIQELSISNDVMTVVETGGAKAETYIGAMTFNDMQGLGLNLTNVKYGYEAVGFDWGNLLLYTVLPIGAMILLLFLLFRRAQGVNNQAMNFGRSRARLLTANTPTVTFDDVAGVDESKVELREVVDFLKSREKFQTLGARIPKGVLLIGPPGTGKTLLARAVAGEAGVPFFSISGSEFVEMFVGVGASRVRDLFDQAKRNAPCIIFIDEIDAVGRQRGAGLGGSHDEREQTLNQILVEMDGFDTNVSVIVMAATNRPDILDAALLRPGRFDRRIILDRPDINGRTAILKVHIKGKPLAGNVNLEILAKQTAGFSGADLANLVNEAAILAARKGKKSIEMIDLEDSIDKVIAGPERKSLRISPKEKEITAYHEAGHALVARMLPHADPPRKISIIPRGMALGYTKSLNEDRYMWSRAQFTDELAAIMGGRAAEELVYNEITTGAGNDIKRATDWAHKMVTDYGMSDRLGPRTFGDKQEMVFLGREISEQRDYGDKVADVIDDEVNSIIKNAHETAQRILVENKDTLMRLAARLIAQETIEGDELEAFFKNPSAEPPVKPVQIVMPPADGTALAPEDKVKKPGKVIGPQPVPPAEAPGTV
jgi:cell division protease FtsH